jgi:hypothetical protein
VQFAHPPSFDKAISIALEFEAFKGIQFGCRKPMNEDVPHVRSVSHTSGNADEAVRELRATVENLSRSIQNLTANKEAPTHERGKRKMNCYTCGLEGHISRNCPNRERSGEEQLSTNQESKKESDRSLNRNGLSSRPNSQPSRM